LSTAKRALLAMVILASFLVLAKAQPVGGDWTSFTLNNNNTRYQANSTINSTNIANMTLKWSILTNSYVTSTPVVANGSVYFTDWKGDIYSANILTGATNWKVTLANGNAISSTPEVINGTVYVTQGPNDPTEVYAFSQSNGALLWNTQIHGNAKQIWASPIVYNGLLYVGITADQGGKETNTTTRGAIYALNASSGAIVWNFTTMIGNSAGAGVWGSVVVDPSLNSIYFGTSNPYMNQSNTLYGYSVMSLNAANGNLNWFYQAYHTTGVGQDLVFGSTPNLFTMDVNNVPTPVIGVGNKNGTYFVLNRQSGELLDNYIIGTPYSQYRVALGNATSNALAEGIRGLAGYTYNQGTTVNPEIFIPSFYYSNSISQRGKLEAIYPNNGTVAWSVLTQGALIGSVSIVPGAVIEGDADGNLYAFSTSTGAILYHTQFQNSVEAGITPAEGFVLVPTSFGANNTAGLFAYTVNKPVPPAQVTLTPSNATLVSGSNEIYTISVNNGIGPFNVELFNVTSSAAQVSNILVEENSSNTVTFATNNLGTFQFKAFAFDEGTTKTTNSTVNTISVLLAPPVNLIFSASNLTLDSGQIETLSAGSTGALSSNTYTFYFAGTSNTPVTCANSIVTFNSATCSFTPAAFGFTYGVGIVSGSQAANSQPISISVKSAPQASISPSNPALLSGEKETYNIAVNGGTGPFNVHLFNVTGNSNQGSTLTINAPGESNSISFVAGSASGTFQYNAIITDEGTTTPFVANSPTNSISVTAFTDNNAAISISENATTFTPNQTETFTFNIVGGIGPFTVELFNSSSSLNQGQNVIIASPGGSNVISFQALATGTFTYEAVATDKGTPFTFSSSPVTVTVSTPVTTTIPQGGGGGAGGGGTGGGGGGGGGGSSKPVITPLLNGFDVSTVSQLNTFSVTICNTQLNTTENYITPTSVGVTINGEEYLLLVNQSTKIDGLPSGCNVKLVNITYIPIEHIAEFQFTQNSSIINQALTNTTNSITKLKQLNVSFVQSNNGIITLSAGNYTKFVSISNVSATTPNAPAGFDKLSIYNITVSNTLNVSTINLTATFRCGVAGIQPYILENGTWARITPYSVNVSACTISFSIPLDPIVALMQPASSSPAPLKQPANATTTLQQTVAPTSSVEVQSGSVSGGANDAIYALAVIAVVVIIVGIAYSLTRKQHSKKAKKGN
jgi:polyvinyl alcohol dehydrogenase (cytochrome)